MNTFIGWIRFKEVKRPRPLHWKKAGAAYFQGPWDSWSRKLT